MTWTSQNYICHGIIAPKAESYMLAIAIWKFVKLNK